ncbi:fibronectin type III-like domain-domain-containing protein [Clohesyomyces aquaticus]|uniref:beta-glucosidase n=1 Tax=Clohesyomyces aquaticus TaxID=1231657 RepID=A0A1Y1ZY74_9PLEO|nr:fibronectin type III-like domain-domain-containing protein [Clohesyomyces aquaticus]
MNRVNGTQTCENNHIQNEILKKEICFKGVIVPDVPAPDVRSKHRPTSHQQYSAYTTFDYNDFTIVFQPNVSLSSYASGKTVDGGRADLFTDVVTMSAAIKNTGKVAGGEAAQLYIGFPENAKSPAKQLRGFQKVFLEPGEIKTVKFTLQRRDLSVWDTEAQGWKAVDGNYAAWLGKSSRNIATEVAFELRT